jgi:hypothetical protein
MKNVSLGMVDRGKNEAAVVRAVGYHYIASPLNMNSAGGFLGPAFLEIPMQWLDGCGRWHDEQPGSFHAVS